MKKIEIVLVIGFGVSVVSDMNNYFYADLLSSICLVSALIADFFIAPALIIIIKPFGKERT